MKARSTMRALRQISLDGPEGLRLVEDVAVPRPGRGEVLLRVAAAGVNFVDLARGRGTFAESPQLPFVAGFEAAGEIVAVGEGVASPVVGAQVIAAGAGAFAEYTVVPAVAAIPIPFGWTAEQAVGLAINWPTALAALRLGGLAPGETVLIQAAAGATGRAALKLVQHFGAQVIGAASAGKHEDLREAGAEHVVDSRDPNLSAAVFELTGGRGADLVLESAGGATFERSVAAAKRITGRVVVLGLAGGNAQLSNWDLVYRHPVQILGFNLGAMIAAAPQRFGQVMGELMGLIAAGVVTPGRPKRYALAEGPRALTDLESRATVGKLALVP